MMTAVEMAAITAGVPRRCTGSVGSLTTVAYMDGTIMEACTPISGGGAGRGVGSPTTVRGLDNRGGGSTFAQVVAPPSDWKLPSMDSRIMETRAPINGSGARPVAAVGAKVVDTCSRGDPEADTERQRLERPGQKEASAATL